MPKTSGTSADESGILTVWVPNDAKVSVNGLATKSTGSRRQFVSFGLKSGLSYKYVVRAQVVRNGQTQEDSRTVMREHGGDRPADSGLVPAFAEKFDLGELSILGEKFEIRISKAETGIENHENATAVRSAKPNSCS